MECNNILHLTMLQGLRLFEPMLQLCSSYGYLNKAPSGLLPLLFRLQLLAPSFSIYIPTC